MSYEEVRERMAAAADRAGRDVTSITLVAVSKAKSLSDIERVYSLGHRDFGENRAQEMAEKAARLPGDIRWHFVGGLQTNKARLIRPITHLLHSMDRESLGAAWAKGSGKPPPVLLQVNTGEESQKFGAEPGDVEEVLDHVGGLGIEILGLMAIPPSAMTPRINVPISPCSETCVTGCQPHTRLSPSSRWA
jgi:pyridoxal phosphate enzyme (YggS family)